MPDATITVFVDTTNQTYSFIVDPSSGVIPSGGSVSLVASGADKVPLTASSGTPFESMNAKKAGNDTTFKTNVPRPFTLSVTGYTGTPVTIIPKFSLTLSTATPIPSVNADSGAQVEVHAPADSSIETTLGGDGVDLFVDESDDMITIAKNADKGLFTIAGGISPGTYLLTGPDGTEGGAPDVPIKGNINVSSGKGMP